MQHPPSAFMREIAMFDLWTHRSFKSFRWIHLSVHKTELFVFKVTNQVPLNYYLIENSNQAFFLVKNSLFALQGRKSGFVMAWGEVNNHSFVFFVFFFIFKNYLFTFGHFKKVILNSLLLVTLMLSSFPSVWLSQSWPMFILEMLYCDIHGPWWENTKGMVQWAEWQWTFPNYTWTSLRPQSSCPTPYRHPCPWECQCVLGLLGNLVQKESKQRPHQACVYFWSHCMTCFFVVVFFPSCSVSFNSCSDLLHWNRHETMTHFDTSIFNTTSELPCLWNHKMHPSL